MTIIKDLYFLSQKNLENNFFEKGGALKIGPKNLENNFFEKGGLLK
jgi:hypothetical protein